ncbi:MAG: Ig domain-containing protein [Thermodesulfovibrionales bacterium]
MACKGKEQPKPVNVAPPQEVKTVTPEQGEKAISPADASPNQPPRVDYIDVIPLYPKTGDTIKVTTKATDPDGDEIKLIYQWFKNDEPLSETSDSLVLAKENFKRGDNISLNVIPDDGKVKGSSGLMKVIIGNSFPEITSSPTYGRLENQKFSYQVKAIDPDNDALAYSLKTAPSGMTIEKTTGLIQWIVLQDFKGKAEVAVVVSDGHGGEALQSFVFEIAPEK